MLLLVGAHRPSDETGPAVTLSQVNVGSADVLVLVIVLSLLLSSAALDLGFVVTAALNDLALACLLDLAHGLAGLLSLGTAASEGSNDATCVLEQLLLLENLKLLLLQNFFVLQVLDLLLSDHALNLAVGLARLLLPLLLLQLLEREHLLLQQVAVVELGRPQIMDALLFEFLLLLDLLDLVNLDFVEVELVAIGFALVGEVLLHLRSVEVVALVHGVGELLDVHQLLLGVPVLGF